MPTPWHPNPPTGAAKAKRPRRPRKEPAPRDPELEYWVKDYLARLNAPPDTILWLFLDDGVGAFDSMAARAANAVSAVYPPGNLPLPRRACGGCYLIPWPLWDCVEARLTVTGGWKNVVVNSPMDPVRQVVPMAVEDLAASWGLPVREPPRR